MAEKKVIDLPKFDNNFKNVLRNKDFMFLWLAQALSVFTAQMLNFVLSFIIFEKTGSSFYVSLLYLFYILPVVILGLFAGILVDHVSKRKIMIYTNLLQAVIVLMYIGLENTWWYIYPVVFLYSIVDEFYFPAEAGMLPTVVKKRQLPIANFLFTLASYGGIAVGFSLAGEIIKLLGVPVTFKLASVLLILAMLASILIYKDKASGRLALFIKSPVKELRNGILENYRFILRNKIIYSTMLMMLVFQLFLVSLAISVPVLGKEIFNINLLDIGVRVILPIFAGSLLGALFVDRYIEGRKKMIVTGSIFMAGLSILTIAYMGANAIIFYPLILLILFVLGFTAIVIMITGNTIIQEQTPLEKMGAVAGSLKLLQSIIVVLPSLFAGLVIDLIGVIPVVTVLGIALFIFGGISLYFSKHDFRTVGATHE